MKGELLDNNKKKNMNIRLEDEREKNKKLKMMYIIIIAVCIVAVVATGIIQIVKNLPDKEPEIYCKDIKKILIIYLKTK